MTQEQLLDELRDVDPTALLDQARAVVTDGVVGEPIHALDDVNPAMIRHYCAALGDDNPVYRDEAAARGTRHGGIIAPPGMLGVWTMGAARGAGGPRDQVLRRLDAAGYTSVVATDYVHEYLAPLRPGDRVHERRSIEDLVGPKTTALGEGFFVTSRYDYHRDDGELVGIGRMKLLKFRPPSQPRTPRPARPNLRPRPVVNRDNAFFWDGVAAGELRIQRCVSCGELRHPPGPMCPHCRSTDWDHVVASGRGTVHANVVHHHPPLPGVDVPHGVLLVDLEEGVRVVSEPVGMTPREVRIGMPVELEFRDLDDDMTVVAFRPAAGALPEPVRPRVLEDVHVGQVVPGFEVAMTPTFIISSAIATRDYEEVHHDRDIARARGSEDLFPNILTSNGLALRLVTDWFGPEAVVVSASVRLGLPAYAGEVLALGGEVRDVVRRPEHGDGLVTVAVTGRISTGTHLSGTVTVSLPAGAGA